MRLTLCPKEISKESEKERERDSDIQQNNTPKYPWDERYLNWLSDQ